MELYVLGNQSQSVVEYRDVMFQQLDSLALENCVFQQSLCCSLFASRRLLVERDEVEIQLILFQREGKKHLLIASASTKFI